MRSLIKKFDFIHLLKLFDCKISFLMNFQILYTDALVSFIIFIAESNCKMKKGKSLHYFSKKENTEDNGDIAITNTAKYSRMDQVKFVEDSL